MTTPAGDANEPVLAVPVVGAAPHSWRPSDPRLFSRSELKRQTGAHSSAIPAQLADWSPTLTSELGADLEDATRALSDFDRHASLVLGTENTALAPMSAILLRTESASSSQIENLTVSAEQLALAEIGAGTSPNSRTVIGNVRAIEAAVTLTEALSVSSILTMHRELLAHQQGMEAHAGLLREELVWIGKGNAGPREADFVAPQPELVPPALDDLLLFADRADLPALLQIAVSHAQFETIHPFVDGNGRTGRALVQIMLRASGIASHTSVGRPPDRPRSLSRGTWRVPRRRRQSDRPHLRAGREARRRGGWRPDRRAARRAGGLSRAPGGRAPAGLGVSAAAIARRAADRRLRVRAESTCCGCSHRQSRAGSADRPRSPHRAHRQAPGGGSGSIPESSAPWTSSRRAFDAPAAEAVTASTVSLGAAARDCSHDANRGSSRRHH